MVSGAFGYTFNPCSYSDHNLVSVNFQCKQTAPRGPGLWKFNSSLTLDDDYTSLLGRFLQGWKLRKSEFPDLRTWWDIGKSYIREIMVDFVTSKRREKRLQRSNLVRQLCLAEQEPVPSAGVITDLRQWIKEIDKEFLSGVIVRSKELWLSKVKNPQSISLIWRHKMEDGLYQNTWYFLYHIQERFRVSQLEFPD